MYVCAWLIHTHSLSVSLSPFFFFFINVFISSFNSDTSRCTFLAMAPSFYLVMMIVTCTPTANNIMIMTEIAGVFFMNVERTFMCNSQLYQTPSSLSLSVCL